MPCESHLTEGNGMTPGTNSPDVQRLTALRIPLPTTGMAGDQAPHGPIPRLRCLAPKWSVPGTAFGAGKEKTFYFVQGAKVRREQS